MPIPSTLTGGTLADVDLELTRGAWPPDLRGEMVISGPEPAKDLDYCLFGFGAITRISLQPGTHGAASNRFALRSQVIDTPSKRLYDAAPEVFTSNTFGYSSPFGMPNQANTAPLPWGDRLFATWDVGRPVEVDPITLQFLGDVGYASEWGPATFGMGGVLPFYFSSAHPIVDPLRDLLFTVKLMPTNDGRMQLVVVAWSGEGGALRTWPVAGGTVIGSAHTLSQTRDWLILADSGNFKSDMGEMAGGPRTVTIDEGAPVYLIRKDQLLATAPGTPFTPRFSAISPTTGHFFGVWDDSDGIRVLFEHMDLMDLGFQLRAGDVDANGHPISPAATGFYNMAMAPNTISEWTFDPASGAATRTAWFRDDWTFNLELSAMDWSTEGLSHPTLHHVAYQGYRPDAVAGRALDLYRAQGRVGPLPEAETPGVLATFRRDGLELAGTWTYHDCGDHITSPIFAPRRAGARPTSSRYAGTEPGGHDGYVVLPVLSDDGLRVEVFDAAHVSRGPLAVLEAPGTWCLPAVLHAAWMPEVDAVVDAERIEFADDLDSGQVDRLDAELAEVVRRVADDLLSSRVA